MARKSIWPALAVLGLASACGQAAPQHAKRAAEATPRPAVRLAAHAARTSTRASAMTVSGRATSGSRVTVKGRRTRVRHGRFHARVKLALGTNRIRVVARRHGYETATAVVTIRRRAAPAPTPSPTPTATPTPTPTTKPAANCDPNYSGACLDPNASDYDCAGGSGDGPEYTGPVRVVGDDHYGLDRDGDGDACES